MNKRTGEWTDAENRRQWDLECAYVEREARRLNAHLMWAGFYRCPTTGRIIEAMSGDDKVLWRCQRSNPLVPAERTAQTGTHIVRFLEAATVDEYLDQQDADALKEAR
mgnify:CR=1 FL=1